MAAGILVVAAWSVAPSPAARAQDEPAALGTTVGGLLAAAHSLSPTLRAAALDVEAARAKARGAGALDDPTISDSYQYYRDPGVFSAHTVMLTQSFPLWGKRGLRRAAARADVTAARGGERAERDALDERIKVAFAQYYTTSRDVVVNREIAELARRMRDASAARYGQGGGDQAGVIQVLAEETAARSEAIRLEGALGAAQARLNVLVARPPDAPLAAPLRLPPSPSVEPTFRDVWERARAGNPTLSGDAGRIDAARTRGTLADKAWYPDISVGAGPLIQTNHQPVGFAATVGFNIPVPWGREKSGQQEAAAQLGAAQQRYAAAALDIEGALGEAVAELHAARSNKDLVQRAALPEAQATFRSILANYSQGKGDLVAAIAAEHRSHEQELTLLQAELDEQVALARIERLIGGRL